MKSGFLAVMALLGHVSAVQLRKESMYDPEFYAGLYTNILLDVDSQKHNHDGKVRKDAYDLDPTTVSPYDAMDQNQPWTNEQRKDWFKKKNEHDKDTYKIFNAQLDSQSLVQRTGKDVYDLDPTTVSPYDAMDQHHPWTNEQRKDWFEGKAKHDEHTYKIFDAQIGSQSLTQKPKRDSYDHDSNTASPYDAGANINGGNVHGIKSSYTDNDVPIGPKEKDLVAAIKKGYWWDKELEKELARPAGAGQADARTGFGGAIPVGKDGKVNCEAVGAACEAPPAEKPSAEEKKAADDDAKAEKETKAEAEKIIEEEKKKAEKAAF